MKNILFITLQVFIDIFMMVFLLYLTYIIRCELSFGNIPKFDSFSIKSELYILSIVVFLFFYEKIYVIRYDFWQETYKIYKSLLLSFMIVLAILTLLKVSSEHSRLYIFLFFLLSFIFIPIEKRIFKKVIYKLDYFKRKLLIVGEDKQAKLLKDELDKNWYFGIKVTNRKYEGVIVISDLFELDKLNKKISKFLEKKREVYVVPYLKSINFANSDILEYSNIRLNSLQVENKLLIQKNLFIKRVFDFLFVILILPIFIVLHVLISIMIKLDTNVNIFFKQKRLGKNGKYFLCYKYTTMISNADEILKDYLKSHPEEIEYYSIYHKYKNDPRVTRFGKFLRKTSLDELPQLINVMKNEMSIIGPRPYMLDEEEKLGNDRDFILKVKPGITGLWQISGRNNLTFQERKNLEIWYIKNWSLWYDFVILLKTVKVVLLKEGAK